MSDRDDVDEFLKRFKMKLKVFNIIYVGREKNTETLLDLEITPADRTHIISNLNSSDYCKGPLEETMHGRGEMWVFGKKINKKEIYIKIAMGYTNSSVICISFHEADGPLDYPFRQAPK